MRITKLMMVACIVACGMKSFGFYDYNWQLQNVERELNHCGHELARIGMELEERNRLEAAKLALEKKKMDIMLQSQVAQRVANEGAACNGEFEVATLISLDGELKTSNGDFEFRKLRDKDKVAGWKPGDTLKIYYYKLPGGTVTTSCEIENVVRNGLFRTKIINRRRKRR